MTVSNDPLFSNLSAEDANFTEPQEIESLCINCGENGITKLLLTRIPHYKAGLQRRLFEDIGGGLLMLDP